MPLSLLSRTTMSMTCVMIFGARPSDGSSSSSTRGRAIRARAITSICRSPPDKVAASLRRRSASTPNRSYASASAAATVRPPPGHARPGHRAEPQVLFHGEFRDDALSLGDVGDSGSGHVLRAAPGLVRAVEQDPPAARAHHPADRPEQRGLARAVGAEHGRDARSARRDRDAVQRPDLAVTRCQVLDREGRGAARPGFLALVALLGPGRATHRRVRSCRGTRSPPRDRPGSPSVSRGRSPCRSQGRRASRRPTSSGPCGAPR